MKRRYIIRKYIMAESLTDALKAERKHAPDDGWIDDEWLKAHPEAEGKKQMGFTK